MPSYVCTFFLLAVYFEMMKKWKFPLLLLWLFFLISPVIFGYLKSNEELIYSGLIFNPIDGYSYYAKMYQGWSGSWSFILPYSSMANDEIYIFSMYLFLGNISRILGLSIPFLYHFVRILFSICLFFALDKLIHKIFKVEDFYSKSAFISLLFGGGLGWLYFLSGELPMDFWVAESYIFLSAYSNLHFVLTFLILIVMILFLLIKNTRFTTNMVLLFLSIVLVNVSPFAAILSTFLFGLNIFFNLDQFKKKIITFLSVGLPTLLFGLYQYLSIHSDPILSKWNDQNITSTPSVGNLFYSYSPYVIGIIFCLLYLKIKKMKIPKLIFLIVLWIVFSFILSIIPFNLQRRFLVGLYLPIAIGFWYVSREVLIKYSQKKMKLLSGALVALVLPSNLLIYSGTINALKNYEPIFYVKKNLVTAMQWMTNNQAGMKVVLANEEDGLKIPGISPFRVVYGHPFESINADATKQLVEYFWGDKLSVDESKKFLVDQNIDFILCEYNSQLSDCPSITKDLNVIYNLDKIAIFQVRF